MSRQPRVYRGIYGAADPERWGDTWLEPEAFAYPGDAFTRRACARFPNGKLCVVRCKVPDTFFTIPARARTGNRTVRGYLMIAGEPQELHFHLEVL